MNIILQRHPSENKTKNEQNVGRFLQQTKTEIRTTVCFDIKAKIAKWFTKSHHSVMSIFQKLLFNNSQKAILLGF